MRKIVGLTFLLTLIIWIVAASGVGLSRPSPDAAKGLIGTWRLVSMTRDGKTDPNRGPHPTGLIYYDGTGHMAVQIMPDRERPKYAGTEPTPDEAKAAITGYIAYFGTYTINEREGTITHHRMGNINPSSPIDVVRRYEFPSDDRLILRPVENQDELTWERIK